RENGHHGVQSNPLPTRRRKSFDWWHFRKYQSSAFGAKCGPCRGACNDLLRPRQGTFRLSDNLSKSRRLALDARYHTRLSGNTLVIRALHRGERATLRLPPLNFAMSRWYYSLTIMAWRLADDGHPLSEF